MTRRRSVLATVAVALTLALAVGGCGDDDDARANAPVALDGSPRLADASGRLVDVADDFSTLTLDGDRTYDIDDDLLSFAAADGSVQPLLRWVNQYVQVGLADGVAIWVGGISAVVDLPDQPEVAYFTDVLVAVGDDRATFRSGTVLDLAPDVAAPGELPAGVVATIDVSHNQVTALEPG